MKFAMLSHFLGIVVWVGGMFFAYMALRPAAAQLLDPPHRLTLWEGTFGRFFPWVWASVALILFSGLYMLGKYTIVPIYIYAMLSVGIVMMMIFAHVFFAPYAKLKRHVVAQDWKAAGAALAQIRFLVGLNLSLGLLNIVIGVLGEMLN